MKRVLVTGANGFVGSQLCQMLADDGYKVRAAYRKPCKDNNLYEQVVVDEIGHRTDWEEALQDVDYVIHLAARVHVMKETSDDPLTKFREVNLYGTTNLARQAAQSGVKRLVYISSIKVNGESTNNHPFTADDEPSPADPYAISKAEAEAELLDISRQTGLEIAIIRPPLVYGPGVRGNFLRLLALVNRGIPLPLANINNARNMVSLTNMCDLLITCLEHPKAAGNVFLLSDGVSLSTSELIKMIAHAMGIRSRLFPFPLFLLKYMGFLIGQHGTISRLCGSLEVDIEKTQQYLDWIPPQPPDEGIQKAVEWFLENKNTQ